MTQTVVIGGGVAGLAAATLLAREGHDVRLLERNSRVGGRAGTYERDGFRFDTGPSWYLMPEVFEHYFELLGTSVAEQLDLRLLDPGYRVFPEPTAAGQVPDPITVPYGRERVRELFEELEPGSGPEFDRYMDSASQVSKMATRYFLYNTFARVGSLMVGEVLSSLNRLRMLLTQSLKRFVNKRFQHPVIRQILGYPAVFLGTHPEDAPAMYHLMSALDLDEGVLYPMGGFWAFVERMEALALEAGVTITTGAEVTGIDCGPVRPSSSQKPSVRGVNWRDERGETHYVPADIVVSGADLHHTETKLVPEDFRSYPEPWWQKRVSGPGAVIVLLGVKGKLPELPHHSLFFTRDWDSNFEAIFGDTPSIPNPTSVYVCKPSETDDQVAPPEHENLFVLVPITPDPTIGSGGSEGQGDTQVEATADAVIDQIAEWAKIPDLRERIVVRETLGPQDFVSDYFSWQGGMLGPAHILSQSAMFRAQNVSKKVNGLFYAGATTAPGVGLPMCLISAELVLKHVRGDHSAGPTQADATSDVRVRN